MSELVGGDALALEAGLQEQAARDAAEAPVPVTVILLGKEHEQFEKAMAKAKDELGRGARRGQCLAEICSAYLGADDDARDP